MEASFGSVSNGAEKCPWWEHRRLLLKTVCENYASCVNGAAGHTFSNPHIVCQTQRQPKSNGNGKPGCFLFYPFLSLF